MGTVEVFLPAAVSAGNDTCVFLGRSINLNATGGASYLWEDDGTFVGQPTGAMPEVMPEVETTYFVTITDANGCTITDSYVVNSQVGISELDQLQFNVFPNPNNGEFKLTLKPFTNSILNSLS